MKVIGKGLTRLFYIAPIDNLESIIKHGILSHEQVEKRDLEHEQIYSEGIVTNRCEINTPDGRSLWSFANLYFRPRNAMLYRVIREQQEKGIKECPDNLAIISVRGDILGNQNCFVSIGNAARDNTPILPVDEGLQLIRKKAKIIDQDYWKEADDSKNLMMSEYLVPDVVPPEYIDTIYVASEDIAKELHYKLDKEVVYQPNFFFEPSRHIDISRNLQLVDGDMFFSTYQTLTISVNCVGVMGAGLASRARYLFPDMFTIYQDLCKNDVIKIGTPYLLKLNLSVDSQLSDEEITNSSDKTGFLLFPTKDHYRNKADIKGIEQGLQWIRDNYHKEGIESLAMPALGCGLGWLSWRNVGPLMCTYLYDLDIPVKIYLPQEKTVSEREITTEFLIREDIDVE